MVQSSRVGQKQTVFGVDNFATVNGSKVCDMSKFCLEKKYKTCMSVHIKIFFV